MALVSAYIVPHPPLAVHEVGRGEEMRISSTLEAYREVAARIARHAPATIVFISPHTAYYGDWIYIASGEGLLGNLASFRAPQVHFDIRFDSALRDAIVSHAAGEGLPVGEVPGMVHELDHGLMVPLYFIDKEYRENFKLVSIGGSGLPRARLLEFGRSLARTLSETGKPVVLVASGDLSHKLTADGPYGYDPQGPLFDEAFGEVVRAGNVLAFADLDPAMCEAAAECGLSGFIMLAGALDEAVAGRPARYTSELLSLEGPFGVGYGVAAFEIGPA